MKSELKSTGDERLFYLAEAYRRGYTVEDLHEFSAIDVFFLHKLFGIVQFEKELKYQCGRYRCAETGKRTRLL
nr:hypothetical protein P5621_08760 [Bacillus subtilis]